ncbi:MAG: amidase family protein, partial [Caulobacterales bacterium]
AQRVRRRVYDEALELFRSNDVLLAPATPFPAPALGQPSIELNGQTMPMRPNIGVLTQPLSCIGLPVISAPIAQDGLPIGVQIIAAPWREDLALQCAAKLEAAGVAVAKVVDPC